MIRRVHPLRRLRVTSGSLFSTPAPRTALTTAMRTAIAPARTAAATVAAMLALMTALGGCSGPPPQESPDGVASGEAWEVRAAADPLDQAIAHAYAAALSAHEQPAVVADELAADEDPAPAAGEMILGRAADLAGRLGAEQLDSPDSLDSLEQRLAEAAPDAELLEPSPVLGYALAITSITAEEHDLDSGPDAGAESMAAACDGLRIGVPSGLEGIGPALSAGYDCEPGSLETAAEEELVTQLIEGGIDGALLTESDPTIEDQALVALEDDEAALPEDQYVPVAAADVAAERPGVTADIAQQLDAEGIAQLRRLLEGPDALDPAEAAEYWLVERGLLAEPSGWG